jgi:hypothetical protein
MITECGWLMENKVNYVVQKRKECNLSNPGGFFTYEAAIAVPNSAPRFAGGRRSCSEDLCRFFCSFTQSSYPIFNFNPT